MNKQYAENLSQHFSTTPRAFLLSLVAQAAPHALLVAYWGRDGAAVLSIPTREYFQSSSWVEEKSPPTSDARPLSIANTNEAVSVRTGSDFWAGAHTTSDSTYSGGAGHTTTPSASTVPSSEQTTHEEDDADSQGTERGDASDDEVVDEVGAQDAFVAGMIYALSRSLAPGTLYSPAVAKEALGMQRPPEPYYGKWRLDECLRCVAPAEVVATSD